MIKLVVLVTLLNSASLQSLPPLDDFLSRLFEVTSNQLETLTDNFNFRPVAQSDIKFILHRPPPQLPIPVSFKNLSTINPSKPTKLIIHGWQATGTDDLNKQMAEEYHKKGNYNVIAVDWSQHSKKVYVHSASSTKDIGEIIGDFLIELTKEKSEDLANVHLIGHSLGGHVAGFAGQRVANKTGRKVGRITGLDVAAPMFEVPRRRSAETRLSKEDADFVDVIHTNAGFLGVSGPIGTVDFYVENGGPLQSNCFNINIFESFVCSHQRSFDYFLESIGGKKYEALACPNSIEYHILACNGNKRVVMGEDIPRDAKGTFYLDTNSALPYSKLLDNPFGFNPSLFKLPFLN